MTVIFNRKPDVIENSKPFLHTLLHVISILLTIFRDRLAIKGIAEPCSHFNQAPSTSDNLYPPPPSSFQPPPSSLQHPQRY